jgi:hypothetical protein
VSATAARGACDVVFLAGNNEYEAGEADDEDENETEEEENADDGGETEKEQESTLVFARADLWTSVSAIVLLTEGAGGDDSCVDADDDC